MKDDEFEWDDAKAQSNLKKHVVGFEAARLVFEDVFALEWFTQSGEPSENRFVIIGMVNTIVLMVVYTERGPRIRIISARKATRHEEREYYRGQTAE
jgi:uncharacterized DUF497 family protein